jgi:23S rRNA pseudouridine1911/1915/1917 synthase
MFPILFEDNYMIAVQKPAGLQVEQDRWGNPSLQAQIQAYFQKSYPWKKQLITGVVHRLDRQVSGIIVFAKTPMALKALTAQFAARRVRKIYLALVEGIPPETSGELVHWLTKDSKKMQATVTTEHDRGASECRLRYRVLNQTGNNALLEIELLTGRYHQIRAQMSAVSCPVLGDKKYGSGRVGEDGICLHAHRLTIVHPKTGEVLEFISPKPDWGFWENLFGG